MGSELEQEVDTAKGDITDLSDITETGTTVNNIVHKDGTETITGTKSMTSTDNDVKVKTTPVATTSAVNQAYVESTVDGVNNLVHKSGSEEISGTKTFNRVMKGIYSAITTDSSTQGTANYYKKIAVLNKTDFSYVRNHVLLMTNSRTRTRACDLIEIYTASAEPSGISMVLRGNTTENYTYILSHDSNYIYISILCNNSQSDAIQCCIIAATGAANNAGNQMSNLSNEGVEEITETLTGVEVGRLTP